MSWGDSMQRILKCEDPEKMMKVALFLLESDEEEIQELGRAIRERALFIGIKHVNKIVGHFPFLSR